MDPVLQANLEVLGIAHDVPNLRDAADSSQQDLEDAEQWLRERVSVEEAALVDVVVLGSYARLEASGESDFDYLVVPFGLTGQVDVLRNVLRAVDDFIVEHLGPRASGDKKPGATGLFGNIVGAVDMVERIGLEQDTNANHTRRVLLIQESRSIFQPDRRRELLENVFDRYLYDYRTVPKPGPPRFLLNDLVRYWYTLAVDYQAKRWERLDRGWPLRYLKLLNSRKVCFAGSMMALLLCDADHPATSRRLAEQFSLTPLARLCQVASDPRFAQQAALVEVVRCVDRFAEFLADGNLRTQVGVASTGGACQPFEHMKDNGKDLDVALRAVFFDSFLREQAERYLVF